MSRIQQILDKADRDGTARRVRSGPPGDGARAPQRAATVATGATAASIADRMTHAPDVAVAPPAAPVHRRVQVAPDALLVAVTATRSSAAEQYRALRARLAAAEEGGRLLRAILVTSPGSGDGKTLTTLNLAITMAQEFQRRIVVVDADLRKAGAARLLGLQPSAGLGEVLAGTASLDDVLLEAEGQSLTILPAGAPATHPAELLGSSLMRATLAELRSRYDRVIIDTPPCGPLSDARVVAPLVDGILMVVRAGHTPTPAIERALDEFDPSRLLGFVLNEAGEGSVYYGPGAYTFPDDPVRRRRGTRPV